MSSDIAWSEDLLEPRGLLGEVVKWVRESSGMEQPKFALAASLTVCGALLGRVVKDRTGQRTNLYTLAVGFSSAGKDAPIKCVQLLVRALGRGVILCGETTSDSALEILLDAFPKRLLLLDEIGHYIVTLKSAGAANGHLRTVIPMLTKLWSSASGSFQGKARALDSNGRWKPPKTIVNPCACVYGTTVPNVLFDGMTFSDFSDGSIPRFLCFQSMSRTKFRPRDEITVPTRLKERLLDALGRLGENPTVYKMAEGDKDEVKSVWNPARLVGETSEAATIFDSFEEEKTQNLVKADIGDQPLYLWGKSVENARRVALIVASLCNPDSPEVDAYAADYAVRLVRVCVSEMVRTVRDNVASSKQERDSKDVANAIRRRGAVGISLSELTRATRSIRRYDRDDIVQDLVESGIIREESRAGVGRKTVTWYTYEGEGNT